MDHRRRRKRNGWANKSIAGSASAWELPIRGREFNFLLGLANSLSSVRWFTTRRTLFLFSPMSSLLSFFLSQSRWKVETATFISFRNAAIRDSLKGGPRLPTDWIGGGVRSQRNRACQGCRRQKCPIKETCFDNAPSFVRFESMLQPQQMVFWFIEIR